jgi:hypothetical protein
MTRHWPFLIERRTMPALNERGRVKELYQRLFRRAMSFLSGSSAPTGCRVVHTEVTVERQGVTVLLSGVAAADFDICPLCGQRLAPTQADQIRGCLQKGPASRHELPGDGACLGGKASIPPEFSDFD